MHTGLRVVRVGIAAAVALSLPPSPASAGAPALRGEAVQRNLAVPWDVGFTPNGEMLVTERAGRVRVYASALPGAPLVRTITVPSVRAEGEAGLMGIAVDIDHATNRFVYVCASRQQGTGPWQNEVLRFSVAADGSWTNLTVLLGGMQANRIHNGCALEMDRFGRLWVGMGDANVPALAQDRRSLNGKILRINRDGTIPADNPTIAGTRDAVYTMGHRNPQGIAVRPGTDRVYAAEHGPTVNDEVNLLVAGGNYGWPCYTGAGEPYSTSVCGGAPASNYLYPLWASGGSTIATSGAAWASGRSWADFDGNLFVSTLKERDVRRFGSNADGTVLSGPVTLFEMSGCQPISDTCWGRLRAMVDGPGGQLYLTTSEGAGDRVVRISQATGSSPRLAGPDRYATAAEVSRNTYPDGAPVAYIATGENFPDALAGSAASAYRGGPLLLVRSNRVTAPTAAELDRLNPQRIVVLGSEGVVSSGVFEALRPYALSGDIRRIAGADRYQTAARLATATFARNPPAAFIVTGQNFPDAVSASASAGFVGAPLLLVRGNEVPSATRDALAALGPQRIFVVGGPSVVSDRVASELRAYAAGGVTRLAGADRYATSAAVARQFWSRSNLVYAATGQNFPDALAAGAAAGWRDAPLLLVSSSRVAETVGQEMLRLRPTVAFVAGSEAVVSAAVATHLRKLMGAP